MTRKTILALTVGGLLAGGAVAPALASADDSRGERVCIVLTDDPQDRGPAPVCVWLPSIDRNQEDSRSRG